MEKEALFYVKLKNNIVQCKLCPHFCVIKEGERGKCNARENRKGKLISIVYGKPCSVAIDPIEKKPFYHFLPGEKALSIATTGCNLACKHCQNWQISQAELNEVEYVEMKPEKVIDEAKKERARIISYTYTEPTIFYEYMLDTAKIAKKEKIRNTTVTNGFINPEPLKQLCRYIEASNIDIKAISDKFYKEICNARLNPVLEAIRIMHEKGIWIELTNLIIPSLNDKTEDIKKLVSWIKENLGENVPLHFTAFYPCHKLSYLQPTSLLTLRKAREIALKKLNFVYTGNLQDEGNNTFCPECKQVVIKRIGFEVIENKLRDGKCPCGEKIPGVWR